MPPPPPPPPPPAIMEEPIGFGSHASSERRRSISDTSPSDAWAGIALAVVPSRSSGCIEEAAWLLSVNSPLTPASVSRTSLSVPLPASWTIASR